jgi:branched-chain amino acid transport system permease protein
MTVIAASFLSDHLVSILNGFTLGMLLFILAVGLSLIFGLLDVLNLAHGALYLVGGYIGIELVGELHPGPIPFIPAAFVVALIGLGLGAVLYGLLLPLRRRGHLDQALLTIGLSFVIADLLTIVWGTDFHTIRPPAFMAGTVVILGHYYPVYRLVVMGVGVLLAVLVYLLFEYTQLGAVARATAEDREMLGALGVNVRAVMLSVLALGTALATFAGVVGAPIENVNPGVDETVLILALIVIVIGGLGSIAGAFVGAVIVGEVQSLGVALIPEIASFAVFGVMALVLVFRPTGLFGR